MSLSGAGLSLHSQDSTSNQTLETGRIHEGNAISRLIDDIIDRVETEMLMKMGYQVESGDQVQQMTGRRGAIHFNGDVVIDKRDRIEGNVVIRNGTLTVRGSIEGDVIVLNGDAVIEEGGAVTGSVTSVNGKVRMEGGTVSGTVEEQTGVDVEYVYREDKAGRHEAYRLSSYMQEDLAVRDLQLNNIFLGFNRVEGFSLGAGSRKNLYWDGSMALSLYGQVGYAFKAHRWRAMLGATRQFPIRDLQLLEIGAEIYTLTDTKDDWVIGRAENDLAAFFVHQDFRDYYNREGYSIYAGHYINGSAGSAHLRLQYLNEAHSSMENRTDWALFVRDKSFRENPAVQDGQLRALRLGLNAGTAERHSRRNSGWSILATAEFSTSGLRSEYEYNQYIADIRRYQPVSKYDNLNLRLRIGSAEGELPIQRVFDLGGLGTLPGFPYKTLSGNRIFLLNTEYVLSGSALNQLAFFPSGLFNRLSLLLFMDTGWTGEVDPSSGLAEGFGGLSVANLKTSLGVGIGSDNGSWRLGFAWRTDKADPAVVFLRIARPF